MPDESTRVEMDEWFEIQGSSSILIFTLSAWFTDSSDEALNTVIWTNDQKGKNDLNSLLI